MSNHCSYLKGLLYLRFLSQYVYGKLQVWWYSKLPVLNFFPQLPQNQPKKGHISIAPFISYLVFKSLHLTLGYGEADYPPLSISALPSTYLLFIILIIILNLHPLLNKKKDWKFRGKSAKAKKVKSIAPAKVFLF